MAEFNFGLQSVNQGFRGLTRFGEITILSFLSAVALAAAEGQADGLPFYILGASAFAEWVLSPDTRR